MPPEKMRSFKLPKHLLEMKFMKKTKEKEEHLQEDEDRQTMFSHQITRGMLQEGPKIIEEPSLVPLLGLLEGRFSFQGMNPEIERIMVTEELLKKEEEERRTQESKEKSVSDADMARHLSSLSRSVSNKFKSKKLRIEDFDDPSEEDEGGPSECYIAPRKKARFMKPSLD